MGQQLPHSGPASTFLSPTAHTSAYWPGGPASSGALAHRPRSTILSPALLLTAG